MPNNEKHPKSSPPTFNLQFGRPWSIVRPRLYRHLEAKYVEAFFTDGSLRLSSFAHFSEHPNEQRRDLSEGKGMRMALGSKATIGIVGGKGHDCYVLCGTLHNTEGVRKEFVNCDASIAIDNITEFANAVSLKIPFFKGGFEGMAIYQDDTMILKNLGDVTPEEFMGPYKTPDGNLKMEMIFDVARIAGGVEEYFIKHSRFARECEYRLLWASSKKVEPFIDINVPEATRFCRHVTKEN